MGKLIESIRRMAPGTTVPEYLYQEVVIEGRTATDVATEHGVSREAVCQYLRKLQAKKKWVWHFRKPRRRPI